jgi:hypothetical protein
VAFGASPASRSLIWPIVPLPRFRHGLYEPCGEHGASSVHAVPHGLRPRGTLSSAAETGVAAILTAGSVLVTPAVVGGGR